MLVIGALVMAHAALAGTLSGRVTSGGRPVAGAFVAATGGSGHGAMLTGASGGFSLSLPNGIYELGSDAPGYAATVDQGVKVRGASVQDVSLAASGATLKPAPVFGGGATVAADGTPGVFYLAGANVGDLYRTLDWGGTWTQVTVARDDGTNGLSDAAFPSYMTTSGYPGEVAVSIAGAGIYYSTDYGVSWHLVGHSGDDPNAYSGFLWAHAGARSVLIVRGLTGMYVADMSAAHPELIQMIKPYLATSQLQFSVMTVAAGSDQPWLATADEAGDVSIYPLTASADAPAPTVTIPGFVGQPLAIGFGGQSAPGAPPSGILVTTPYLASMTVKAPGAATYPAPSGVSLAAVCSGGSQQFSPVISQFVSVTPNTSGSYGAAWDEQCWLQDIGGTLTVAGGYGNGAAIDAGYNATNASPGTDAVVMIAPQPQTIASYLSPLGVSKLAASNGGYPVPLTNQAATATAGTGAASAGVAVNGITAGTVHATTFGPDGSSEVAAATDIGGSASSDGGSSFTRATFGQTASVAWWRGASGTWLLFGAGVSGASEPDLVAGFENWTASTPAVVGGNVTGSTAADFALAGYPPGLTPGVDAIAGVPGQDVVFVGANADDAETDRYVPPPPVVDRASITPGPAFSNVTPIGPGVITKPGPLAYCPTTGSASSVRDVLLVIAEDGSSGAIYRVSGATSASPAVTQVASLPGGGLPAIRADCASGTVIAASGGAGAGMLTSSDGGQTFTEIAIHDPGGAPATIRALALTPGYPSSISVGDSAGFIQSSLDGGRTWTVVNDPSTGVDLNASAIGGGGIWDIEAPPAVAGSGSSIRAPALGTGISALTASRAPALPSGDDLVAGPGEFIGRLLGPPIPIIRAFKLTNRRFRLGSGPTATVANRRPSIHRGSAFVFTLSAASTTVILFSRETPGRVTHGRCVRKSNGRGHRCTIARLVYLPSTGRRVGGKCVARTSRDARAKRCTIKALAAIVRRSRAGVNRVAFSGRVGRVALPAGTYRAVLLARIGTGPDSQPRTATFTIITG